MAKRKQKLNPKQELFCKLYASEREFFGSGVESYIEAYSSKKKRVLYKTAVVNASRLLTNANILERISEIMDIMINDIVVDKELAFTIIQKSNLPAKVAAIKEYNILKQRIIKKVDVTSGGEKINREAKLNKEDKKLLHQALSYGKLRHKDKG